MSSSAEKIRALHYKDALRVIEGGFPVETLTLEKCKAYLRVKGLSSSGNKAEVVDRICLHLDVERTSAAPPEKFTIPCHGAEVCIGDSILYEEDLYDDYDVGGLHLAPALGKRRIAARVIHTSAKYNSFKFQVLWSDGVQPLPNLHCFTLRRSKLEQLRNVLRQTHADETSRNARYLDMKQIIESSGNKRSSSREAHQCTSGKENEAPRMRRPVAVSDSDDDDDDNDDDEAPGVRRSVAVSDSDDDDEDDDDEDDEDDDDSASTKAENDPSGVPDNECEVNQPESKERVQDPLKGTIPKDEMKDVKICIKPEEQKADKSRKPKVDSDSREDQGNGKRNARTSEMRERKPSGNALKTVVPDDGQTPIKREQLDPRDKTDKIQREPLEVKGVSESSVSHPHKAEASAPKGPRPITPTMAGGKVVWDDFERAFLEKWTVCEERLALLTEKQRGRTVAEYVESFTAKRLAAKEVEDGEAMRLFEQNLHSHIKHIYYHNVQNLPKTLEQSMRAALAAEQALKLNQTGNSGSKGSDPREGKGKPESGQRTDGGNQSSRKRKFLEIREGTECYNCGKYGHYQIECPEKLSKGGGSQPKKKRKLPDPCPTSSRPIEKVECVKCGKYGHDKNKCPEKLCTEEAIRKIVSEQFQKLQQTQGERIKIKSSNAKPKKGGKKGPINLQIHRKCVNAPCGQLGARACVQGMCRACCKIRELECLVHGSK